jgi:two-component system sensor histidine kinase GlrK
MLLGFALVSAPLLLAVVISATKIRNLSEASAELVRSGVEATHRSQELTVRMIPFERSISVYGLVLNEVESGRSYENSRGRVTETLSRLERIAKDSKRADHILKLRGSLQRVDAFMSKKPVTESTKAAALGEIDAIKRVAYEFSRATGKQIDSGLQRQQQATADAQQYLFWQSAGLILLTALLVAVFTSVLMRPIRQIDSAISQLGKGTFARPILVRGPTDLVDLGRQLEWLRMRLLDLAQERNRFLRHMSHELKTPLANIREGTELLMDGAVGELDSSQREVATILRDNSIKLQQLIENLLSFSAWQARHSGLEISEFRLRPLVKAVLETHQLTLLAQRVHLDLKIHDIELRADRAKLKLILDNLLSNALKYSPRGGTIYIHARTHKELLVLDVADTGPGINQNERNAIFEAFYSGSAPVAGHLKGTGIGLSVVNEFVQAHGGSIEILDGIFPGAHFRTRLPLTPATEVEPA